MWSLTSSLLRIVTIKHHLPIHDSKLHLFTLQLPWFGGKCGNIWDNKKCTKETNTQPTPKVQDPGARTEFKTSIFWRNRQKVRFQVSIHVQRPREKIILFHSERGCLSSSMKLRVVQRLCRVRFRHVRDVTDVRDARREDGQGKRCWLIPLFSFFSISFSFFM